MAEHVRNCLRSRVCRLPFFLTGNRDCRGRYGLSELSAHLFTASFNGLLGVEWIVVLDEASSIGPRIAYRAEQSKPGKYGLQRRPHSNTLGLWDGNWDLMEACEANARSLSLIICHTHTAAMKSAIVAKIFAVAAASAVGWIAGGIPNTGLATSRNAFGSMHGQ